jgi:DsbC/DsbD-like thiol-disulfide interchange protein
MLRPQVLGGLVAGLALAGVVLAWHAEAGAESRKSDGKVKATASATKIDDKGKQTVTITLDIAKGWHLYANPVNHNNGTLNPAATKLTIAAKVKPAKVEVKYPAGKTHVDKGDTYDIFEGTVKLQAIVTRAADDTSPLEITIAVQACDTSVCLAPGKVKLTVK